MSSIVVTGGVPLRGSLRIPGAKNAVLPILAATLLAKAPVRLLDCPRLADVANMLEILRRLGCDTQWEGDELIVDPTNAHCYVMPESLSKELRSSIFLLGPVLARFGRAVVTYPGGCEIGLRPIDLHLSGLRALNVRISEAFGRILCDGSALRGADIRLDYPSVGATENVMMAAVAAPGLTRIHNAAREPEICDLQNFLCALGYKIRGAGTKTICIEGGRPEMREITYRIMPDRINAGTFLCAAAITGGDVTLYNVQPRHITCALEKLREAACELDVRENAVRIVAPKRPREIALIETLPHPGFPTDMQALFFSLCTIASGTSVIVENVFENRFKHVPELVRMGAMVTVRDRTAVIHGVERLTGASVCARDLRGGAALVLAGLRAQGCTTVANAEHIDRGYEMFEMRLAQLGAEVRRADDGMTYERR